jgi:hypothetical protein
MCWGSKVCTINVLHLAANNYLASGSSTISVRQRKDENHNIALMHVGLIAGTPVFPQSAFSVDLLGLFYHIRRRQPSIGVQGFVKAMCAFRQVCVLINPSAIDQLLRLLSSSNMFTPWSNVSPKPLISFLMCSADYKRGLTLRLAATFLTGP